MRIVITSVVGTLEFAMDAGMTGTVPVALRGKLAIYRHKPC